MQRPYRQHLRRLRNKMLPERRITVYEYLPLGILLYLALWATYSRYLRFLLDSRFGEGYARMKEYT